MASANRKRQRVKPAKVPAVLFAAVSKKDLERAVGRGRLRGAKGAPLLLYERRRRATKDGDRTRVVLRIAGRAAAVSGVHFCPSSRGCYEADEVPLTHVACSRLPRSIRSVPRMDAGGGVVVSDGARPRVLLLRKGKGKGGRWVLPKGKRGRGERLRRAARREVLEETGLSEVDVDSYLVHENYFDREDGQIVFKCVSYYLMRSPKRKARLRVNKREGFTRGRWMTFAQAFAATDPVRAHRALRKARLAIKSS
jgi:8-oxo-dGTP pyrophosphatase MutT (NUDIX family)